MQINRLYIWVCFFFCLALTAAGILVFFRIKAYRQIRAFRFLLYFLIMVYTFGFYAMWSDVFLRILIYPTRQYSNLASLSGYLALIGTPFLLIGMMMFILWAIHLLQKKPGPWMLSGVALLVILIVMAYLVYIHFDLLFNIRQVYALLVISLVFFTGTLLGFSKLQYLETNASRLLVALIFLSGAIHIPLLLDQITHPVAELLFIFLFFLTNTSIGIYFNYTASPALEKIEEQQVLSFDSFVRRYGITSRESEVVIEIYKGKTNKEIADHLFVTVQTIKDHTHRIYQKTNVKSRTQLASLLRKFE